MSTIDSSSETTAQAPETRTVDFKLEVVVVPVSDAERAKQFYASLGWREDGAFVISDDYRVLGGGFHPGTEGRAAGPDPEGRSYGSYASFSDPDGNGWLLQEITERLPGRV